jgi:methylated-DNA-[protein]-cysteine S-methyltransferase
VNLIQDELLTPLGKLLLVAEADGTLVALEFADHQSRMHTLLQRRYAEQWVWHRGGLPEVRRALEAYFAGDMTLVNDLPVSVQGTDFQRRCWLSLRSIPCGQTISYAQQAQGVGSPKASRAVGQANGLNPVAIVLPCHRVIGSNQRLTGYASGLDKKRWLLEHERRYVLQPTLQAGNRAPG